MRKNILRTLSLLFFGLAVASAFTACGEKEHTEYFPPRADNRVYFIYMASDNSLYGYSIQNINDIVKGATKKNIGKGRVLVFYDRMNLPTQLVKIEAGPDGKGRSTVVWEEPQGRDLNTALPATFADALDLMWNHATADGRVVDSYILDMWSHGDSWEQRSRSGIVPRTVANDGSYFLELEDFVDCLPDKTDSRAFDAVVFAQCYSASVEMLYLLRNKTDLVIGSPPEMPGYGMPYNKLLASIFAPTFDYKGVVDGYCGFYDNMSLSAYDGQGYYWRNSGTMAAFDCSAFTPDFVSLMRSIYLSGDYQATLASLSSASEVSDGESIGVQSYSYMAPYKYFDLGDFVNNIEGLSSEVKSGFWQNMNRIVAYARTGGRVFYDSNLIDRNKFSGMSTYIMLNSPRYNTAGSSTLSLNDKYKLTSWYNAVYK